MKPEQLPVANTTDAATSSHLPVPLLPAAHALNRTQMALGLLRDVVQESSAEYWYELGVKLNCEEEWLDATYALRRCLEHEPRHWRCLLQLTCALAKLHQTTTAANLFLEAYSITNSNKSMEEISCDKIDFLVSIFYESSQTCFNSGLSFVMMAPGTNSHKICRIVLRSLKANFPELVEKSVMWFWLSAYLWSANNAQSKAISDLNRAIELDPSDAGLYGSRGYKKSLIDDYAGAMTDFNQAMALQPYQAEDFYLRGKAKYNLKKYDEALLDLNQAISMEGYGWFYELRSTIKTALGDDNGAWKDHNWDYEEWMGK